ncbi:hypothetical protein [Tenacibaculum sp. 190524A02b]
MIEILENIQAPELAMLMVGSSLGWFFTGLFLYLTYRENRFLRKHIKM